MSRSHRITLPEYPHHVTQRGNRKANVFLDDIDRNTYLKMLARKCIEHSIRIWAYCMMTNHVHLIAVPRFEHSLSRAFQWIDGNYAKYFNLRYSKTGHLWQGQFNAAVLDESHCWNAVRYVEQNPVRAGIERHAQNYPWSSAAAHCGLREDLLLSSDLPLLKYIPDWNAWLKERQSEKELNFIRRRTHSGRPCADDDFIRKLEIQLGRKLLPEKTGRKKKETETEQKLGNEVPDTNSGMLWK
jgi:putative transposase